MIRFARQLGFELLKLFARKRTYMGFVFFLGIELLILSRDPVPVNRHRLERDIGVGFDLSAYFGGLTIAFQVIAVTIFTLGSIYLALVCGDIMSKEVEDGTMRMVLSRPVSRLRILALKYLTCIVYTALLSAFVVLTSLGLSVFFRGVGSGLVAVAPWEQVTGVFLPGVGLERFALGFVLLTFCLLSLSTLGFMFSCFNIKPATATVLTLSVYIFDDILRNLPAFAKFRNDFLTHHTAIWQHVFEMKIPWPRIADSLAYLTCFDIVTLAIATAYFLRRDFKS